MKQEQHILDEVEKTLGAFDNEPRLEANPFLLTRVNARMASGDFRRSPAWRKELKAAGLVIVIVLNIITAVQVLRNASIYSGADRLAAALSSDYSSSQNDVLMGN